MTLRPMGTLVYTGLGWTGGWGHAVPTRHDICGPSEKAAGLWMQPATTKGRLGKIRYRRVRLMRTA